MLERMDEFFDSRLAIYDEHQLDAIASARDFYPFTAGLLPREPGARVLDLGCGTGLELEWYFQLNPTARVTGIDLAPGMLDALRAKFPEHNLELICDSYFDVPLGAQRFDAAVSVESLHHFTQAEKIPLYTRLCTALVRAAALSSRTTLFPRAPRKRGSAGSLSGSGASRASRTGGSTISTRRSPSLTRWRRSAQQALRRLRCSAPGPQPQRSAPPDRAMPIAYVTLVLVSGGMGPGLAQQTADSARQARAHVRRRARYGQSANSCRRRSRSSTSTRETLASQ